MVKFDIRGVNHPFVPTSLGTRVRVEAAAYEVPCNFFLAPHTVYDQSPGTTFYDAISRHANNNQPTPYTKEAMHRVEVPDRAPNLSGYASPGLGQTFMRLAANCDRTPTFDYG